MAEADERAGETAALPWLSPAGVPGSQRIVRPHGVPLWALSGTDPAAGGERLDAGVRRCIPGGASG